MKIIMILLIGYALLCCASAWVTRQRAVPSPADEDEDDEIFTEYDFYSVQQKLIRIQQTADRIQSIEHLITDIEITSPERHELPLEMRWADTADGQEHIYSFWMDGRASTQLLLETACQEREQLRTSLSEQIADLYSTVVTKAVTKADLYDGREGAECDA